MKKERETETGVQSFDNWRERERRRRWDATLRQLFYENRLRDEREAAARAAEMPVVTLGDLDPGERAVLIPATMAALNLFPGAVIVDVRRRGGAYCPTAGEMLNPESLFLPSTEDKAPAPGLWSSKATAADARRRRKRDEVTLAATDAELAAKAAAKARGWF